MMSGSERRKHESVVKGAEEESDIEEEEDEKKLEMIKRANHDFYISKMMAEHPHYFMDLRREVVQDIDSEPEGLKCKNCSRPINEIKERLWYSKRFGFFCKLCLHPKESDVEKLIE